MARFVVTELEGYPIKVPWPYRRSSYSTAMLSCMVIDTAYNHELVAVFNQEDVKAHRRAADRRESIRSRAHGLAAILEDRYAA